MAKDTLEEMIEQAIHQEAGGLAATVSGFLRGLLKPGASPIELEEAVRNGLLSFGGKLIAHGLVKADPELRIVLREKGHRAPDGTLCRGKLLSKGCKPVTLTFLLGPTRIDERWTAVCQDCGAWVGTVEELVQAENGMSAACASVVAVTGVTLPYLQAQGQLKRAAGLEVDDNRIQRTVAAVAPRGAQFVQGPPRGLTRAELPRSGDQVLILMDGGRIRLREGAAWREPCVALVMWRTRDGKWRKHGLSHPLDKEPVLAGLDDWMTRLVEIRGIQIVVIGDGAGWIWDWAAKYPPKRLHLILDYYHLKENVWKAAHALFGEGTTKAAKWVDQIMDELWDGHVFEVVDELFRMKPRGSKKATKRLALEALEVYLVNHEGLIHYAKHRRAGRNIGSGGIESFCKQLFTMRMKGPGMFWGVDGAAAVMTLRTVYLTGHWDKLWQHTQAPERKRA